MQSFILYKYKKNTWAQDMFLLELIIIRKDERKTDKLINQFAMTHYIFNDTEIRSKEIIIGNILCFLKTVV